MNPRKTEEILDAAIEEIRADRPDEHQVKQATQRVWLSLQEELDRAEANTIRGCSDFQDLMSFYLKGQLSDARKLLFEDHMGECVTCRKALTRRLTGLTSAESHRENLNRPAWWKWAGVAAALLLGLALFQIGVLDRFIPSGVEAWATLQATDGQVFRVTDGESELVAVGQRIEAGSLIRTDRHGGAILRLADGSIIELSDRTELLVQGNWRGETISLEQGNIIVQASQQDRESLFVSTDDCVVEVKGTTFSVNSGMKGSRVSVIEGEVWVRGAGTNALLTAGQQFSSNPKLALNNVASEVAWSRNHEHYAALLSEVAEVHRDFMAATYSDELRYSSELANLLPAETVAYGALPNLSGQVDQAYQNFLQRLQESPALSEWYGENIEGKEDHVQEILHKLSAVGEQIGQEIVIALIRTGDDVEPVILAEVKDSGMLRALVEEEVASINSQVDEPRVHVVGSPAELPAAQGLFILINSQLIVASPSAELVSSLAGGSSGSFVTTNFYQSIQISYAEGVDWLFAVDVATLAEKSIAEAGQEAASAMEVLGVARPQGLILQRKQVGETAEARAVLDFEESPEEGMLSWLGSPGPMGGLKFVSPDAHLAMAFVVKQPVMAVDRILSFLQLNDPEGWQELVEFQLSQGIDFREDLAAPLGGEVVVALDGPVVPAPSWVLIVEVYDPMRLQQSIEWGVTQINSEVTEQGHPGLTLESQDLGGLMTYTLKSVDETVAVEYIYHDGYLLAAPSRAVLASALQNQQSGVSLLSSPRFQQMLPQDSSVNMSAFFYQNLIDLFEPLASGQLGRQMLNGLSQDEQVSIGQMLKHARPTLVGMYSEPGRVTVASSSDLDVLWMNLGMLNALGGMTQQNPMKEKRIN